MDWVHVAKLASTYGITFPTNGHLEGFLREIEGEAKCKGELLEVLKGTLATLKIASRQLTEDHRMVLSGRAWGWRSIAKAQGLIEKIERQKTP